MKRRKQKRDPNGLYLWPINIRRAFMYSIMIHALILGGVGSCGGGSAQSKAKQASEKVQFDAVKDKDKSDDKNNAIEVNIDHREIIDKPKVAQDGSDDPADKDGTKAKVQFTARECPDEKFFGGIGVNLAYFNSSGVFGVYGGVIAKVLKVYPGYPADKNGVLVGDVIYICDSVEEFRKNDRSIIGEPGTPVTLRVIRPDVSMDEFSVTMIREKICYKEEKKHEDP